MIFSTNILPLTITKKNKISHKKTVKVTPHAESQMKNPKLRSLMVRTSGFLIVISSTLVAFSRKHWYSKRCLVMPAWMNLSITNSASSKMKLFLEITKLTEFVINFSLSLIPETRVSRLIPLSIMSFRKNAIFAFSFLIFSSNRSVKFTMSWNFTLENLKINCKFKFE